MLRKVISLALLLVLDLIAVAQPDSLTLSSENDTVRMLHRAALPDSTWDFYPTYSAYESYMTGFAQQYPTLCRWVAFDTLASGRRLMALVISDNVDSLEAEPRFLYTSSMHGDELVGYILMLRLADYLLKNYGTDSLVTRLVDDLEIWINPLANPDGTYRSGNHTVSGSWRYNANAVDINRNFPDPQDGPHPDGNAWQAETMAFMALANTQKFNMSANIHGGAEVCNYPWDTWAQLPADDLWWQYVCNMYADSAQFYGPTGYFNDFGTGVTNGFDWYSISGGRQDYMNYFHHCREFTLEISNSKLPSASQLPVFWNANYRSLLNYLDQARYGIHGVVSDSLTGHPLKARVFIQGHDIDSSHVWSRLPHGDFYRYLAAGNYSLSISSPGYITRIIPGISTANQTMTWLNVRLLPTISGSSQPMAQLATRLWYDAQNHSIRCIRPDSGGDQWSLQIFSAGGMLIKADKIRHEYPLPSHWSPGLYIVRIISPEGQGVTLKVVLP